MLDNTLDLYIKNEEGEVTLESVLICLTKNGWIDEDYSIEGDSVSFTSGDYDSDFEIMIYGDCIQISGDNSYEVVEIWNQLKSVAL